MSDVCVQIEKAKADVVRLKRAAKGWTDKPPTDSLVATIQSVRSASDLVARRVDAQSNARTIGQMSQVMTMQTEVLLSLVTMLGVHAVGFD